MLVLSRKPGETIRIGDDIVVKVTRIDRNRVRLAVQAPTDVVILRSELYAERGLARQLSDQDG